MGPCVSSKACRGRARPGAPQPLAPPAQQLPVRPSRSSGCRCASTPACQAASGARSSRGRALRLLARAPANALHVIQAWQDGTGGTKRYWRFCFYPARWPPAAGFPVVIGAVAGRSRPEPWPGHCVLPGAEGAVRRRGTATQGNLRARADQGRPAVSNWHHAPGWRHFAAAVRLSIAWPSGE